MGIANTTRPINPIQLKNEAGHDVRVVESGGDRTVVIDGLSDTEVAALVASHTADSDYGRDARELAIKAAVTKAQNVLAGQDTYTNAQVQAVLARLVIAVARLLN